MDEQVELQHAHAHLRITVYRDVGSFLMERGRCRCVRILQYGALDALKLKQTFIYNKRFSEIFQECVKRGEGRSKQLTPSPALPLDSYLMVPGYSLKKTENPCFFDQ